MERLRIFVDCDGVVADWMKAACETCGLDPEKDPKLRAMLKSGMSLEDTGYIGDREMWDKINACGPDWWENLEPLPWAKELYERMNKLGDFCFLTSASKHIATAPDGACGKIRWIYKHFNTYSYLIGYHKWFCAAPNTLLVDDSEKKIDKFDEHGGHVFRWPVSYTILDGDVKIEDVFQQLEGKCRYLNKVIDSNV